MPRRDDADEATLIYTDGACLGNPGPGGWAWLVPEGPWKSGCAEMATNQRMELTAVLEGLTAIQGPLEVRCDSNYVVKCFNDGWWQAWVRNGWRNSKGKPVANRDLWEPLVEMVTRRKDVTFVWVQGHANDPWNAAADRLAVRAARLQLAECGPRATL
ncbi:MAG: ribonuclease H [Acidimicrobiales bacterium]|nr:MAG: ribonuclease H [Acidimicrobiales bacterium]